MLPGSMTVFVREFTIGSRGYRASLIHLAFTGTRVAGLADSFGAALDHVAIEPEVIGRLLPDAPAERAEVSLDDVPEFLVKGLLATEDRYFYYHFGFDPIRIIEAAIVDVHSHRLRQGASTLTQQLARTFIERHSRSFHRKVRELSIALVLEMRLTKKEILERYINDVPMGEYEGTPIYGLPLAARYFFGKDLRAVSPAEAATLIGMIQAPTLDDPRRHPDAARGRRATVLALMRRANAITGAQYDQAVAQDVGGQVADVDEVADAGAVRRGVVVAENLDGLPRRGRSQQEWDQMRFGLVRLAQLVLRLRAARIEVAQRHAAQPAVVIELTQDLLDDGLRLPVRADWREPGVLRNRNLLRIAVHRGGRRKHQAANSGARHRFEQRHRASHVV